MLWRAVSGALVAALWLGFGGCELDLQRAERMLESSDPHDRIDGVGRLAKSSPGKAGRLIAPLLRDRSPRVRRSVVAAFGTLGCRGHVNELIGRLDDADLEVRLVTVRVLGDCRQEAARPPLLRALRDPSQVIRQAAIAALEVQGLSRGQQVGQLARLELEEQIARLGRADDQLRATAARLVGMSGRPAGVAPLARLLSDRSPLVVEQAARAIGRIGDAQGLAALGKLARSGAASDRRAAAIGLAEVGQSQAATRLSELVADPAPAVRRAALEGLAKLGPSIDGAASRRICAALVDEDLDVAKSAARLAQQVAPLACRPEVDALSDRAKRGESSAVELLRPLKLPSATAALMALVRKDYEAYRREAVKWISDEQWREMDSDKTPSSAPSVTVRKKRGVEWILSKYPRQSSAEAADPLLPPANSESLVVAGIEALGDRPEARPWLTEVATEAPPALRAAALAALAAASSRSEGGNRLEIDPPVVEAVLLGLRSQQATVRRAAMRGCPLLGARAAPTALALIQDKDFEIRGGAARCLGALGSAAAVKPLLKALAKEGQVAVIEALAQIGDRQAAGAVAGLLREDHPAGRQGERVVVVRSLGALADPTTVPVLERELFHPDWRVRRAAALALVRWSGRSSTRRALTICQQDYHAAVRRACSGALNSAGTPKPSER